jgi:DNA-binding LytR/AlgR family response regulator
MKATVLIIVVFILGIVYYFSFDYINNSTKKRILNLQIENAKTQADIVSNMLEERINQGYSKKQVRSEFQNSIENMSTENSFVCMFDSTGKEICHPKRSKIGAVLDEDNSVIKSLANEEIEQNFKHVIMDMKSKGGIRKLKKYSEIVYLSPVKSTDWIVASHASLVKFQKEFKAQKEKGLFVFILVWLSTSLLIFLFLFHINAISLKKVSELNRNTSANYFKELKAIKEKLLKPANDESGEVKRLLADKGTKLKPVLIENISFVYTQDKITYIVEHDNTISTINTSLDDLYKLFDKKIFFRATRQVIISIRGIDKIEKSGNTQLNIKTIPKSQMEIRISKAKLTEFKKWAGRS